jgi:hypothetical protein
MTDNAPVIASRRRAVALLLVTAIVIAALLPPAHIHLVAHDDHDHDHAAAIEHSHWSSHGAPRAAFDDDDGRVIFVDHPARATSVDATFARPAVAVVELPILAVAATFVAAEQRTSGNSPRDGPARGLTPPRAPPALDTL